MRSSYKLGIICALHSIPSRQSSNGIVDGVQDADSQEEPQVAADICHDVLDVVFENLFFDPVASVCNVSREDNKLFREVVLHQVGVLDMSDLLQVILIMADILSSFGGRALRMKTARLKGS